jgi:hypothetical protein
MKILPFKTVEKPSICDVVNSSIRRIKNWDVKTSPNSHPPVSAV